MTEQAEDVKKHCLKAAKGKLRVSKVEKKQRKRNPLPLLLPLLYNKKLHVN